MMIWSELRESEGMLGEWVKKRGQPWILGRILRRIKTSKHENVTFFCRVCKVIHEMWDLAWFGSDLHRFWSKSRFVFIYIHHEMGRWQSHFVEKCQKLWACWLCCQPEWFMLSPASNGPGALQIQRNFVDLRPAERRWVEILPGCSTAWLIEL